MRMHETGLIKRWIRKHKNKQSKRCGDRASYTDYQQAPVTLEDMSLVLQYTLLFPLCIALFVFLVEILTKVRMPRKCYRVNAGQKKPPVNDHIN